MTKAAQFKSAKPASDGVAFAKFVETPDRFGERFLLQHSDFVNSVRDALQPYRFEVSAADNGLGLNGDEIAVLIAGRIFENVADTGHKTGKPRQALTQETISAAVDYALKRDLVFRLKGLFHPVRPMSLAQIPYMNSMLSREDQFVVGAGPTGTGKTHLAIAAGISLLAQNAVKQIVVTRPHVLLEGEVATPSIRMETKRDEQFSYIEDIFHDLIGHDRFEQMIAQRQLLITPLGLMRGRTFNDSFIILDEAQNIPIDKMRMAVTRIGQNSRMIVTGDPAQIDLREKELSGLAHLFKVITKTDIARIHKFENRQIIRSHLVKRLEELFSENIAA